MRNVPTALALGAALLACSADEPAPPAVVSELAVSIDADNNCSLESKPVVCKQVAAVIRTRYPTSKPRVDICLDEQARYEAAVEVMNSLGEAGFTVGNFECAAAAGG